MHHQAGSGINEMASNVYIRRQTARDRVIQQDTKKIIDAVNCGEEYNMEFRTELGPRKAVIGSKSEGQSSGHTNGA